MDFGERQEIAKRKRGKKKNLKITFMGLGFDFGFVNVGKFMGPLQGHKFYKHSQGRR